MKSYEEGLKAAADFVDKMPDDIIISVRNRKSATGGYDGSILMLDMQTYEDLPVFGADSTQDNVMLAMMLLQRAIDLLEEQYLKIERGINVPTKEEGGEE